MTRLRRGAASAARRLPDLAQVAGQERHRGSAAP